MLRIAGISPIAFTGVDRLTTWTLGAIKERNLALEGYCQTEGCGRFYVFDVDALISGMGADYLVPEILPGVVCKDVAVP